MDERLSTLVDDLRHAEYLSAAEFDRCARRGVWLEELSPGELAEFFQQTAMLPTPLPAAADRLLARWLESAVQARRQQVRVSGGLEADAGSVVPALASLYFRLRPESRSRGLVLAWLAVGASPPERDALLRLLIADPPQDDQAVVQALAPLFQESRHQAAALFPRLLDAVAHPPVSAGVLDLANFLTRERLVERHPASDRAGPLSGLLGELVQSLMQLEERPDAYGDSPQELSRRVARGVELAVSLCDALALIGDQQAIGKLNQALLVRHRRLRTEAAAALARLGEQRGVEALVELAAEPVARLRVLAYAEELGLCDQIDPQYTTPQARAEAELCVWLAEPTQYGLPPTSCELVDRRRQYWPGYREPVDCFLFRFQYVITMEREEARSFSNIGIAGPLAHAFIADLGDLSPDDIYAAFAGWQAEHAEIREYDVERLSKSEKLEVERLKRRLTDEGLTDIQPQRMGYFFGEKALIAVARREGVEGVAVVNFQETVFFPRRPGPRPVGPQEAYCIYKGRRLLAAFNRR